MHVPTVDTIQRYAKLPLGIDRRDAVRTLSLIHI